MRDENELLALALRVLNEIVPNLSNLEYDQLGYDPYKFSHYGKPTPQEVHQKAQEIVNADTQSKKQAIQRITLQSEEMVILVLPGGQEMMIQLSDVEQNALPEIDVWFNTEMTANCYQENLTPAKPDKNYPNVLEVRQIIIPIPPKEEE